MSPGQFLRWLRFKLFGGAYLPPIGATSLNPLDFLVQKGPAGDARSDELLTQRRHDWPLPVGYEVSDSVLLPDGRVLQTFSMAPWGPFSAANGDGGQIAEIGADGYVRFTQTRDGGTPHMQYFVGGTGWIVFGQDAVRGQWKELVAELSNSASPNQQTALSLAYTRYRLETIPFKFAIDGAVQTIALPAIISEHYSGETIAKATALERSYFALGWGLVRWEAWSKSASNVNLDAEGRYFPVDFSGPPAPGWLLDDVRTYTNIVTVPPTPVPVMS